MTKPETPGSRFVAFLLGVDAREQPNRRPDYRLGWWREFWTAMAGRAGAVSDSARSRPNPDQTTPGSAEERRRLNEEWITVRTTRRDALAVIRAARRPARRRSPMFGPIAAAAAVLVIAFSAVGLIAKSAQPNDQLWGVTQVLYPEYARSVEAAAFARTELNKADAALREGKPERAKALLQRIQQQLPMIAEAEGRTDLTARHHELERELVANTSAQNSSPGSPDASSPEQPATPAPETSSTTTPTEPSPAVEPNPAPDVEPNPVPK